VDQWIISSIAFLLYSWTYGRFGSFQSADASKHACCCIACWQMASQNLL